MDILIIDDHVLFRAGFGVLLQALHRDTRIFEADTVAQGLDILDTNAIDAALLSLDLKENAGFAGLMSLHQRLPSLPVVVMSNDERVENVRRSIKLFAMGFVSKTAPVHVLFVALEAAVAGGIFIPADCVNRATSLDDFCMPARRRVSLNEGQLTDITPRERETLYWLLKGMPTKSIASRMGVEDITVRKYVSQLLTHFQVNRRTELIAMLTIDSTDPVGIGLHSVEKLRDREMA